MKQIKKSKLIISIILLSLLIIEVITIGLSRAGKTIDVTITAIDSQSALANKEEKIEANKNEDGTYSLTFPETINGFNVKQYSVTREYSSYEVDQEAIDSDMEEANISYNDIDTNITIGEIIDEDEDEEENESEGNEAVNEEVEKSEIQLIYENIVASHTTEIINSQAETYNPGTTIILTKAEQKTKKISTNILYETTKKDNTTYYKQTLKANTVYNNKATTVEVEAYVPLNSKLVLKSFSGDQKDNISNSILSKQSDEDLSFYDVYEPIILYSTDTNELDMTAVNDSNLQEFDTATLGQEIHLRLSNLNSSGYYKLFAVNETAEDYTFAEIGKTENQNFIVYNNTSIGKYALLYDPSYDLVEVESATAVQDNVLKAAASDSSSVKWDGTSASTSLTALDSSATPQYSAGSLNNPYLITSGADLKYIANQVNSGNAYANTYFKLLVNIDLDNKAWVPIGNGSTSFQGVFDGQGHNIINGVINNATFPGDGVYTYLGLFGRVGGTSSATVIKNLELKNFAITVSATGDLQGNRGYYIGTIVGGLFKNATVENCVVANSSISLGNKQSGNQGTLRLVNQMARIMVGGAIGGIQTDNGSYTDSGTNARPQVKAIYSDVDIVADNVTVHYDTTTDGPRTYQSNYKHYYSQNFAIGGVVGATLGEKTCPEFCSYTGNIKTNEGFAGPIMGGAYSPTNATTAVGTSNYYNTFESIFILDYLRNGTDLSFNNYYYSYSITSHTITVRSSRNVYNYATNTSVSFSQTINPITGTVLGTTDYRYEAYPPGDPTTADSYSKYWHGMNAGQKVNSVSDIYNYLDQNGFNSSSTYYTAWENTGSSLNLTIPYTVNIAEENETGSYVAVPNPYIDEYTYKCYWYLDGTKQSSVNLLIQNVARSWEQDKILMVMVNREDGFIATATRVLEQYELHVNIANQPDGTFTATIAGTGTSSPEYIAASNKYSYQWYTIDIAGDEEIIDGANSTSITNLTAGWEYKIVATNSTYAVLNTSGSRIYGDRRVIFVNYGTYNINGTNYSGNDNNDGYTPQTAVKTLPTAYSKLSSTYAMGQNIIVLMGNYTTRDVYYDTKDSTNTDYQRNATVTGKYSGTDYSGRLSMYYTNSNYSGHKYNFVNGDTTFRNLTFYGRDNNTNSQAYLYAQGHDLVMGKALTMSNYAQSNTNQGLITQNAPAFHVLGGYLQYNRTTLPRNNGTVTINSGAYARVLGGGGSGTSDGVGQSTSHDFTGTNGQHYVATINIDIQNSTKGNYDFDINLLVGGATAGNMFADITINLTKGDVGRMLGGSIGDTVTRPNNMNNYPMNDFIGSTTMNLTGGTIRELYGGSLGRNMTWMGGTQTGSGALLCDIYHYGQIIINFNGTNIGTSQNRGTIYGAGAGGVTGYSTNSSDAYKESYGKNYTTSVTMNITAGTIYADVYGGGYGHTEYLYNNTQRYDKTQQDGGALYGDSTINISGGTINGDIYGGGRGYDNGTSGNNPRSPYLARMEGNAVINVTGSPAINGDIYGAGMGIANRADVANLKGTTTVNIEADISHDIYGGGKISYVQAATNNAAVTNINLKSGEISGNVYGGCNSANIINGSTNVTLQGSTSIGSIFGGCNQTGNVPTSNVTITSGEAFKVYGGNNIGGTTQVANVTMSGGKIYDDGNDENDDTDANNDGAIYGGGYQATTNKTNVTITANAARIPNVFGGGENASVTSANGVSGSGQTNVTVSGTSIKNVFGGSNAGGDIDKSNITITAGTITNIYGANNKGGVTSETQIDINGGNITNVFGGGNEAESHKTTITTNGGIIDSIYGGGNKAGITAVAGNDDTGNTNVVLKAGTITNAFGGSNASGDVVTTNVTVGTSGGTGSGLSVTNVYGGNNQGGKSTTTNVTTYPGTITNVYGGSKGAGASAGDTHVAIQGSHITGSLFGGGDQAPTTVSTNITVSNNSIVDQNVYGGGNEATVGTSNSSASTHLSITNSTVKGNAFAAGNGTNAITYGTTYVEILTGATIGTAYDDTLATGCVFGGGNQAKVVGTTEVLFNGGTIKTHVFGGGNNGQIEGSTKVNAKNGTINGSIYGGGNAQLAVVTDNTLVNIYGTMTVGTSSSTPPLQGSVFGGGNQAETGTQPQPESQETEDSKNILNIAGGEVFGNVYGGANTSKVWGSTVVNIGLQAITDYHTANPSDYDIPNDMSASALTIHGTVFGGGEANASGSDSYDWSYISATTGIDVNIDGYGYESLGITFEKSVFGSGNASSSSGTSTVDIYNLGTYSSPNQCISIQRTDILTIKNSSLALKGIEDSTNDHADIKYTLNHIGDLKLANGSTLYLEHSSNCLTKWESLSIDNSGNETYATITIDENGDGTPSVRNNVYLFEGIQLSVKPPREADEGYGKVLGMTFLGIYTNASAPAANIGAYYTTSASNGDSVNFLKYNFTSVIGKHMYAETGDPAEFLITETGEHDLTKAGFYSNKFTIDGVSDAELEEMIKTGQVTGATQGTLKTYYVPAKPISTDTFRPDYYIWSVGTVDLTTYYLTIEASKYDTLGTKELSLEGFPKANAYYNYSSCVFDLNPNVTIKDKSEVPKIANPKADADYNFGLAMKTGTFGWVKSGSLEFAGTLDEGDMIPGGDTSFKTENSISAVTPDLEFYFYHSQNIQTTGDLGKVKIYIDVIEPNDLGEGFDYRGICVDITLKRKVYDDEYVEQSIQPGKKYDIFTSTRTQIVSDGVFSTYDTIYIDNLSTNERKVQFENSRRVLVSTDLDGVPYYFKAGTKITMLDLVSNETYYYIVTAEDESGANKTNKYYFSNFIKMGSIDGTGNTPEKYDEATMLATNYIKNDELYERYIFHYDFAEAGITESVTNKLVTLQLEATVNNEDRTIIELMASQRSEVIYSLYTNSDATINVVGEVSTNPLYIGKSNERLTVETILTQQTAPDNKRIYDTNFFDEQMGIKISLWTVPDPNDPDDKPVQQDSDTLLGVYFTVEGDYDSSGHLNKYYPRLDGSTRIKIGTKVANSIANVTMHTEENQSLVTGDYTIKIETYGSVDGYYYGDDISSYCEIPITIISGIFGLKVTSPAEQKIFKNSTGLNISKDNKLDMTVEYSSLLTNPILTVSLQRRNYDSIYAKTYEAVDLSEVIDGGPTEVFDEDTFDSDYMYKVAGKTELGEENTTIYHYTMRSKVPTGTYKMVYSIYDGDTFIGSAYEYFIVN